jgi:hypothetical protein
MGAQREIIRRSAVYHSEGNSALAIGVLEISALGRCHSYSVA